MGQDCHSSNQARLVPASALPAVVFHRSEYNTMLRVFEPLFKATVLVKFGRADASWLRSVRCVMHVFAYFTVELELHAAVGSARNIIHCSGSAALFFLNDFGKLYKIISVINYYLLLPDELTIFKTHMN
jgi:hypothetical protein